MITSDRADALFRGAVPRAASVPEWTPIQNKRCLRETSAEIKAPTRSFLFGRFFSVALPFHEFLTVNLSLALHLSASSLVSEVNYPKRGIADDGILLISTKAKRYVVMYFIKKR